MTAPPLAAQSPENDAEIVVVASTKEYRLTGKELHAAQEAFTHYRSQYAPNARLWFSVASQDPSVPISDIHLALVSGTQRVPLGIDEQGRFELPPIEGGQWRVVSRRAGLRLKLRPWVLSPGSSIGDWRLGDLQLQCRMIWAIERQSASPVIAAMFGAVGPCTSGKIAVYQALGRQIAEAGIAEGSKRTPLQYFHGDELRLPTYPRGYGSEARVRVRFAR